MTESAETTLAEALPYLEKARRVTVKKVGVTRRHR